MKKQKFELIRYNPDYKKGLKQEEVEERISHKLTNSINKHVGKSYVGIILTNFFTLFNVVYLIIFLLLKSAELSEPDIVFPLTNYTFIIIVTINLLIGTIQEIKAKVTMNKLKLLTDPTVTVIRDAKQVEISADKIVLDDIIVLKSGKEICTDCVLVSGELLVNESQLTGESDSIKKVPGDTLYSGSFVVSGNGYVRADQIGEDSQIEKLSKQAKKFKKPKSEILITLNKLILIITIFLFIFGIVMVLENYDFRRFSEYEDGFGYWLYHNFYLKLRTIGLFSHSNKSWYDTITSTCTALIGMIPSGLLMMTSATLVLGVIRLSKKRTLVQDIYCVEMLARVDVLCLDKTGTITDGTMNVVDVIQYNNDLDLKKIMGSMNKALNETNATGVALLEKFGRSTKFKVTDKLAFTSDNKYSACVIDGNSYFLGAPEFVLKDGFKEYEELVLEKAKRGYRVICLARIDGNVIHEKIEQIPAVIAFIIIEDHIREDAEETIRYFRENGVEVKVISGDNPVTVSNVARRVGVASAKSYISLDGLTDEEVKEAAMNYTVFGRVKPHQKEIIIKTLKEHGKCVAMTGDGINDILAMKEADCSIAMASGNDAVRSVAQLVLLDSTFSSMPKVVDEGRCAINNVQKIATLFLVKTVFVIILAFLTVVGFFKVTSGDSSFPFSNPSQLLLLELFVIGIPSTVLTLQPNKDRFNGNFLWNVLQKSIPGSLAIVIAVIVTYLLSSICGFEIHLTKTIVVLTTTFIGIMILFQACKPFNTIKYVMFFGMLFMSVLLCSIAMTKGVDVKIFNYNVSEKVYNALELDNIFEYDVIQINEKNFDSLNFVKETVQEANNNFDRSNNELKALASRGDMIIKDLNNATMYHLDDIEYYLENSFLHVDDVLIRIDIAKALSYIKDVRIESKNNLTPAFLTISLIFLSYTLMTLFSQLIKVINNSNFVKKINNLKIKQNN